MWHKQAMCGLAAILAGSSAWAETIRVPEDFPTIQEAIDAASDDDDIVVASGVYEESIDFLGKPISVTAADGPEVTSISPTTGTTTVSFRSFETSDAVLDGFTITGVRGMFFEFSDPTVRNCVIRDCTRGGVLATASTATFTECRFENNRNNSNDGAALTCSTSSMVFTDCLFTGNQVTDQGGAIYSTSFSNTSLIRCSFSGNQASQGGAIYNREFSALRIEDAVFDQNTASSGGAVNDQGTNSTYLRCVFTANHGSTAAGGIYFAGSDSGASLSDCLFSANTANTSGGAVYLAVADGVGFTTVTFDQNSGNTGGAIYVNSCRPTLTTCEFINNHAGARGGAMYNTGSSADPELHGCVFRANVAEFGSGIYNIGTGPGMQIIACTFEDNITGVSGGVYNHNSDPSIEDCMFDGNDASSFGGGIFNFTFSNPDVDGCTFSNNIAFAGAAIYSWDDGSDADVANSLFCGNDPDDIGGDWTDNGGNEFLEECEGSDDCPADINQDDDVNFDDILAVLNAWGPVEDCPPFIRADIDQDCEVGFSDLVVVLSNWGPCP